MSAIIRHSKTKHARFRKMAERVYPALAIKGSRLEKLYRLFDYGLKIDGDPLYHSLSKHLTICEWARAVLIKIRKEEAT